MLNIKKKKRIYSVFIKSRLKKRKFKKIKSESYHLRAWLNHQVVGLRFLLFFSCNRNNTKQQWLRTRQLDQQCHQPQHQLLFQRVWYRNSFSWRFFFACMLGFVVCYCYLTRVYKLYKIFKPLTFRSSILLLHIYLFSVWNVTSTS